MMDIGAGPAVQLHELTVKSWSAFQSGHWFAVGPDCHLPEYQIRAIFRIVMRLRHPAVLSHTRRAQPVAWKNAKCRLIIYD